MSKPRPNNAYSSSNIDTAIIEDLQKTAEVGYYDDLTPLVEFVQKNGLTRSLANLQYFSATNELSQLTKNSQNLAKLLEIINYVLKDKSTESKHLTTKLSLLEESARLHDFYSTLCSNLKFVYKTFTIRKPAALVAITKILCCLVDYNKSTLLTQFMDSFDFNHSAVSKILVPSKADFEKKILYEKSMRSAFVDLWLAVCSANGPSVRKALLTNFKIMNNFWRYLEMERYEVLNRIIDFLDHQVLSEPSFKRATKCRILNENFLYNIRTLFSLIKTENDRGELDDDVNDFKSFKTNFLSFMKTLVTDSQKGLSYPENEFGFPLVVNNITFKVNNKLIFTLLTAMRPWESHVQLQFVMEILNHNHELLPPYMHWIVSNSGGYHEPSLTSYWIGHSLLYIEILKSKSLPLKVGYIDLFPLSKGALTECLSFPSDLVIQLGLQLILLQLQKLSSSIETNQSLNESIISNLPSRSVILPLLNHSNKLIKLTAASIFAAEEQLAPKSISSVIISAIGEKLNQLTSHLGSSSSYDLTLLDRYLSIQSNNEIKWWNKGAQANSYFVSLLMLSHVDSLKKKIFNILYKLTSSSLAFNKKTIESPISALISSTALLSSEPYAQNIWNCLESTISRAVQTPYKYLDRSHNLYNDLSVFMIVFYEQLNYISNVQKNDQIISWVNDLSTRMYVIGEPILGLQNAAKNCGIHISIQLDSLRVKENLTSKTDFAEAVICLNKCVQKDQSRSEIFETIAKLGKFLMSSDLSDDSLAKFISSPESWSFLEAIVSTSISENEVLAISLLNEILLQLDFNFENSQLQVFFFNIYQSRMSNTNQNLAKKFSWILNDDQLIEISHSSDNDLILLNCYEILLERNIQFEPNISKLFSIDAPGISEILGRIELTEDVISLIYDNPSFHHLFERATTEMCNFLLTREDLSDDLLYQIASYYPDLATCHTERVKRLAFSMENWNCSLKIFAVFPHLFDSVTVTESVFQRPEAYLKSAMTSTFVDFVVACCTSNTEISEKVILWIQKAFLYTTKKFAESKTLSRSFDKFIRSLIILFTKNVTLSKEIPQKLFMAQFEVLLTHHHWSNNIEYLEYINVLILQARHRSLDSDKLLQLFIANEKNPLKNLPTGDNSRLRFLSALIIHSLFQANKRVSSTKSLAKQLLFFYLGSGRAEDLLLKDILSSIEGTLLESWSNQVTSWDISDELSREELHLVGEERLFIQDGSFMVISLNKSFLRNTINRNLETPTLPRSDKFADYNDFALKCPSNPYRDTSYDPELVLLMTINNEELVREIEGQMIFDIKKLIDSDFLRLAVTCLGNKQVRHISLIILRGVLKSLNQAPDSMKDKNILRIYISSILHTIVTRDHSNPMIWYIVGCFPAILINPGHFLYERVIRHVLSTPVFKPYEIPLFNTVMSSQNKDDTLEEDNHFRQIEWLIEKMCYGVKNEADLKLLRFRDTLDSIFNVFNLKYCPFPLKSTILKLVFAIQNVGLEGSDMLVTKVAGLSALEYIKTAQNTESFISIQQRLNVDQLTLRLGILSENQKRVRDWTCDGLAETVKRIHRI